MVWCWLVDEPLSKPMMTKNWQIYTYGLFHGGAAVLIGTWFCYQLIAKPGNKTSTHPWPDPYTSDTRPRTVKIFVRKDLNITLAHFNNMVCSFKMFSKSLRAKQTLQNRILNSLRPSDAIWRQRTGSTLAQVMACCLMATSHYLNQCWLIISKV